MRRSISLVVLLTLVALAALPGAALATHVPSYSSGTVQGVVTDAATGQPLGDVCVDVSVLGLAAHGGSATTTASGAYSIGGLDVSGFYKMTFSDCATPSRGYVTAVNPSGQLSFPNRMSSVTRNAALATGVPGDPDADLDGLSDAVDLSPFPSAAFDDLAGTFGSVLPHAGVDVTVGDVAAPVGVRISVGAGGSAGFSLCGFTTIVSAGSVVDVTCGSVTLDVTKGSAQVQLADTTVTVPQGAKAKITANEDGTAEVANLGTVAVQVATGGVMTSIAGGGTGTVVEELTASNLCALTARLAAIEDGLVTAACRQLDRAPNAGASGVREYQRHVALMVSRQLLGAGEGSMLGQLADALR